ncbi:WD repeat-containing protein 44-like [Olea europaea var. sylvestris]|uniref:WD repeat-containing protein 44-like n=1 Tax=Olea europaea var. sylvestris TaxID=158386 RepID=UPI000C1D25D8|nr:WD repeat-containing protein 44-like [Olea europaea var. sylvestris]
MGSFSDEDKEFRFFDASEHIASASQSDSDNAGANNCEYDLWIGSPQSVRERRRKFIRRMELSLDRLEGNNSFDVHNNGKCGVFREDIDRIMESSESVLRNSIFEDEFSSSHSCVSSWSTGVLDLVREVAPSENFICRNMNLNDGRECDVDNLVEDDKRRAVGVAGLDQVLISKEFDNITRLTNSVQQLREKEFEINGNISKIINKVKVRWLSRFRSLTLMMSGNGRADNPRSNCPSRVQGTKVQRVRVRHKRKMLKELSALVTGQDIKAHEGSILTIKFSLDGQYLASAGEDKIVRIWQVVEDDRSSDTDIPDVDQSCIYFSVNHLSELEPLMKEEYKTNKLKSLRKPKDSACIIFPPKVFRILEKPLHIFVGHTGDIVDLSWSKTNCLLSSSIDKTVRLWRVGYEQCLKVFLHSDYVTCVQFNPVNDDYFISGSIDGKVRIWTISGYQVINWTEIRDIVTAVSYRPDGQGGIIGSITGMCRFFSISGNHFQLEEQMCLTSKKKSASKRITGFQFVPQDWSKVLVTCADSQIRILSGMNVIGRYKGLGGAGNQISASFTSSGKHIISLAEDSNVYIWNYNQESCSASQPIRSFECFSSDASVAIPWSGLKIGNLEDRFKSSKLEESLTKLSTHFSLGQDFILDSSPKGSATWPEEKLPTSSLRTGLYQMCKSQYKLFKTSCQSSSTSHAWGLVIVTAGRDGRIRSFYNYGLPTPH